MISSFIPGYRPPVQPPRIPHDYASKSWCRAEWADLSPTHEAPRRRTTDREPEFGPAALSHADRIVLWVSFVASGIATGVSVFFVLTGGAS